MSEIWTPHPGQQPDPNNIFDMMWLMQESLSAATTRGEKIQLAQFAYRSLSLHLAKLPDEERELTLVTGQVEIVDNVESSSASIDVPVSISGRFEDVHCVSTANDLSISVALGIDALSMYAVGDPDNASVILARAKTPIDRVQSIETLAS